MNSYSTNQTSQRDESVMDLMRGIVQDARTLSSKEFTAAKLEIGQEIKKALASGITLAVGLFILALGVLLLSIFFALVLAQSAGLPIWAGFAIIGGVYLVTGVIVALIGGRKLQTTKPIPENSLRSAKEDAQYIREKATGH